MSCLFKFEFVFIYCYSNAEQNFIYYENRLGHGLFKIASLVAVRVSINCSNYSFV